MDFALSEQQQLMRTEVRNLARQFAWSYWRETDRTSAYPHARSSARLLLPAG